MKNILALGHGRSLSASLLIFLMFALALSPWTTSAATRAWDGGGDGQSWTNAANWIGDIVPVAGDDVVIDVVGTNATITFAGGALTLRSLQCEENFILNGGPMTLTNGASWSHGGFVVGSGRDFAVQNSTASFTATGVVNVHGANLVARAGATLSLPTLGSYVDVSGCCGSLFEATGAGSVLDISGMTNLAGNPTWTMTIRALSGGSVNLSNVVAIENSNLYFLADGSNSVVHLEGLTAYTNSRVLNFEARNNGVIQSPNLVNAHRAAFNIGTTGHIPTVQLQRSYGFTITSQNRTLPALTNLDGGSLSALSGAIISLPALSRYVDTSGCCGSLWLASGIGSAIQLGGLTNLAGNPTWSMAMQALNGGSVNVSNVVKIDDSNVSFLADGSNSVVHLQGLTTYTNNRVIALEARNNGVIQASNLVNAQRVNITIGATGNIATTQLQNLFGLTVSAQTRTLPALTNMDGGSLSALSGAIISLPALTRYVDTSGCCGSLWQATGMGSVIQLGGLTNFSGNPTWSMAVQALNGGLVNVSNVVKIENSNVGFLADGSNSVVALNNLVSYPGTRLISFEARNTGVIQMPLFTDGIWAAFIVKSGGVLNLNQLTRFGGFTIQGAAVTLPGITNMNGASISVSAGGSATFPSVTSYTDTGGCCGILWEASGVGSFLSFPALTSLSGSLSWTPTIRALSGGQIYLGSVIQIPDSHIYFFADGTNSRIVLSNLTSYASTGRRGTFEARNTGVIELTAGPFSATYATLTFQSAGDIQLGSLALYTGAILNGNGVFNPEVINNGGTVSAGTSPGILTLATNYVQNSGTLLAELGGTNVGSGYDRVVVNGSASLNGTLQISRINGFAPAISNTFTILSAASVSGSFSNYVGLDAGNSLEFVPNVSASNVTLAMIYSSGPKVIALSPTNSVSNSLSSLTVTFSEPIQFGSFVVADATLTGPAGNIPVTSIDFLSVTNYRINFATQISQGNYTLTVGPNINDMAGNAMNQDGDATNGEVVGDAFQSTLTLNDIAPPTITSVTPSAAVNNNVSSLAISFNEPLLPGTFTAADVTLNGPSGAISLLSLNNSTATNWTATFALQTAAGAYPFSIGPTVQDMQGNSMTGAFTGAFTIDRAGPLVLNASPAGSVTQAVSHIDLTFNEPLNLATFTTGDATLTGPLGAISLSSISAIGGSTYRIEFAQQAASGTYTVVVGPSISDVAGNLMNQDGDATFGEATQDRFTNSVTIFSPDLIALNVVGPTNGLPGQIINVSWIVTNGGNAALSRTISEVVSLSTNGTVSNAFRIASFELTNALPPGAWLARTQSVTLPVNGPAGDLRLVVQTDANNEIPEGNEGNNFALGNTNITIPLALTLQVGSSSVTEGNSVSAVVSRNGSSSSALNVILNTSDAGELTSAGSVTILAGQTEAAFNFTAMLDGFADGPQPVTVQASTAGFISASNLVTVLDADIPQLSLIISNFVLVEGQIGSGTVTREGSLAAPLTVALGSSSPGQLSVPTYITIPIGEASAPFTMFAVNDNYVEATRGYSITAGGVDFGTASGTVTVEDNDQPTLLLSLNQPQIQEGAGANAATLTVTRLSDGVLPLQVQITSSLPGELTFSPSVTFFPGELSKFVSLSPVDDALIESNRTVTLTARALETLSLNPLLSGPSTNIVILDDDGPSLQLAFSRDWVCAGNGTNSPLANVLATLTRSGALGNSVTASISAGLGGFLNLPASVNFAVGESNKTFNATLSAVAPLPVGGTVSLTASAPGLASAAASLQLVTNCNPDLVIQNLSVPASGLTDSYFSINFREINLGAAFAIGNGLAVSNISQKVYLSTDSSPGDDSLLGTVLFNGSVDPYVFLDRNATLRLPSVPGDYWVIVQADGSNNVVEVSEGNNFLVSPQPIHVDAAYTATVSANIESAPAGTPVILSGSADKFGTTLPAPFELVSLHIGLRGTTRVIAALTDGSGNFSATFTPLPGEAGTYTVGASHPGITNGVPTQDTFTLVGMRATPATLALTIPALTTVTQVVTLANLGDVELSGLTTSVLGLPTEFSATATVDSTLAPFGNGGLTLTLGVIADTNVTRSFTVRVTSSEGAVADVGVTLTAESLRPRLVATPAALTAGVVPGTQRFLEFTVVNQGGATSGSLTVQPPVFPFLHVISPPTLPPLAPGESNIVSLQLSPAPTQTLGLYTGDLLVSDGSASAYVPLEIRIVSTNTGTLLVEVTDQFTYYAEGAPRVTNASVTLKDPYTGIILTNLTNDAFGLAIFTNLLEGFYTVEVTANEHEPFRSTLFVVASDTTYVEALMSRETVQFIWTVTPTELGDRTKITIESVFETVVPVPVLTVSPSVIDLADFPNGGTINLTITNHGLLAAQTTRLVFSEFECYKITPLISDIGTLAAKSSITIPVSICHDVTCSGNFAGCPSGGGLASNPEDQAKIHSVLRKVRSASSGAGGSSCGGGAVTYIIPCGDSGIGGSAPVGVANAGGSGCGGTPGGHVTTGSGSGGGIIHPGSGGGNCNPCAAELAGVLAGCVLDYVLPIPDIISCMQDSYECFSEPSSLGCAKAVVSCLEAAGKNVPILGDVLDVLSCAEDIAGACSGGGGSSPPLGGPGGGFGSGGSGSSNLRGARGYFSDTLPPYPYPGMAEVALAIAHVKAVLGTYSNYFGGQQWLVAAQHTNLNHWLTPLNASTDVGSESGNRISANERVTLTTHALTNDISAADIHLFVDRWNRTLDYADSEIFYSTNVPVGMSSNFIAVDLQRQHLALANEAILEAAALGYTNVFEELKISMEQLRAFINQPSSGVCAQVRLRIDQEAVIARDAFRASLEIVNDSSTSLSNITVNLMVLNSAGEIVNSLFAIPAPALANISVVNGLGEVVPGTRGSITWTIVPTTDSAQTVPEVYYVSGSIRYVQNGASVIVPLASQSITVHPLAQLQLTYFHQRDVLGDDPFTDEIEPSVPYSLATMIRNTGFGTARNVRITSAQPQIIENEKGLFIDFQIIATEVAGQNVLPSLTANFGDIDAGEIAIGRWLLKSSLQGLFVEYSATFEHLDGLGDPRASIIQSVDIRELIRIVSAPGIFQDGLPDMLVNDFADLEDLPDKLYLSDGSVQPVSIVKTGAITGVLSSGNLQVTLAATLPAGWSYLRIPDPGNGQYRLKQIVRSDNVSLSVGTNAWTTDRTFIGGGKRPILENNLHLLDYNGPGSYTLIYEALPTPDIVAPTSAITPLPVNSFPQIPLTWTGNDGGGSGISSFDIYVSDNGAPASLWLQDTTLFGAVYPGILGHSYSFYSVAVDAAGNSESAPPISDATTTVNRTNSAPLLTVGANVTVNEGVLVSISNSATDADLDVQTLTFSFVNGAPPNATIHFKTGLITWQTGEGNGPSTNVLGVIVSDNGSPALSATGFVTVVVNEVNQAPVIATAGPFTINEGTLFSHTFTATDSDLPATPIRWSLGSGTPAGAVIHTNSGLFTWTPTILQGPSTNVIEILATDNGQPPIAGSRFVTVIVRDTLGDFIFAAGRTNLFIGESNSVPLMLTAGIDLAFVSFTLTTDDSRLTNLLLQNVSPQVGSASLVPAGDNLVAISFAALPGQTLPVGTPLASLGFQALPNVISAFVHLRPIELLGEQTSGDILTNGLALDGRVVVIGDDPLLEAVKGSPQQLVLWSTPAGSYLIEVVSTLDAVWQPFQTVISSTPRTLVPVPENVTTTFYRAGVSPP